MCVTCLSEEQDASLPSTKRVVFRTNYSIKGSQHKHSKHPQTSNLSNKVFVWPFSFIEMLWFGGHGSNGSLINKVYNAYYGTGYNNSTLIKSWFEMNSYSTQVALLLFEYIRIRQGIRSEIFMLYQSINWISEYLIWINHIRDNIVQ
jgi:hypothetical protein